MRFSDLLLQEQAAERFGIKNDKFYTKPEIAKFCISKCNINSYDRIIEPSAGSGAFSSQIPNCEAYDLVPEDKSIKKQDFLKFNTDKGNILVIGNPPFGKANDLSLKFINNAAKFARTIAFILPKSCQKETFLNKLDKHVHLRRVVQLPKNSFIINGKIPYNVNCNFFIFDVKDKERAATEKPTTDDFTFTRNKEIADFAILRKGYKVGRLIPKDDTHFSEASKYYIKSNIGKRELWKRLLTVTYPEAGMALGSDSISQLEIIKNYNLKFGTLKEEKIDSDTHGTHFKNVIKQRVQNEKETKLISKYQNFSLSDIKKTTQKFNNKWANSKEVTKEDMRDIRNAMTGRGYGLKQVNNDLAQEISKKVINQEINKVSKPEQSNYQERFMAGRTISKTGVVNELPDKDFYVTFQNGAIKPKDSRGFGIDGILNMKGKWYFIENKITEFTRQQDGSILRFAEASNAVGVTPIYVCGMQYDYFKNSEALKNMIENKKLKIMSPSAFNSWLEKNNIKFVKNKIKFNSPELKQIKLALGDKVV